MNRRPEKSRKGYDSFSPQHTARLRASAPDVDFFSTRKKRRIGLGTLLLAAAVVATLLLLANLFANLFVFVDRVSVPVRGLVEAFEGYTILHISDLKGARFGAEQSLVRFALGEEAFDVVVMTGDMISEHGNAKPFYELIELLKGINPNAPIYFIAGDGDPTPASMAYEATGSPFAAWVLGARQRGAELLSSPQCIERNGQRIWISTSAQLSVDVNAMRSQYEKQYVDALAAGDENAIELATYNLQWLEYTSAARKQMTADDCYVTLTHALPPTQDVSALSPSSLPRSIDLLLSGHYLGGMMRLPAVGALFVPSSAARLYGLLPGGGLYKGLQRQGATWTYVSAGLGAQDAQYPAWFFRLFNPPQVTLISLTPSAL